jgi:hypothetical protein
MKLTASAADEIRTLVTASRSLPRSPSFFFQTLNPPHNVFLEFLHLPLELPNFRQRFHHQAPVIIVHLYPL